MSTKKESKKSDSLAKYTMKDDKNTVVLDFSRIPNKEFEQVLTDLIKVSKTQLQSLVISTDFYKDVHPNEFPSTEDCPPRTKSKGEPLLLQNSAYIANSKAIKSILLALKHILSKTTSLTSIKFRAIIFSQSELETLVKYLRENITLKSIAFEAVKLYDKGFNIVVQCGKKEGIESFECSSCGLTDDSILDIKSLLNYHHFKHGEANFNSSLHGGAGDFSGNCIKELILRDNYLSTGALYEIGSVITDIPILFVDLSYNKEMDEQMAMNIRKNAPHCELLVNREERGKPLRSPKRTSQRESQEYFNDAPAQNGYQYPPQAAYQEQQYYGNDQYYDQHYYGDDIQPIPYYQQQMHEQSPKKSPARGRNPQQQQSYPQPQEQPQTNENIDLPQFDLNFDQNDSSPENEAIIGEDLKVVGPRAKEFAKYLQQLETTLLKFQEQKRKEDEEKAYFMRHKKPLKRPKKRASSVRTKKSKR